MNLAAGGRKEGAVGRAIVSFLPGRLEVGRGGWGDYVELERFHYLGKRPATVAGVWAVRYGEGGVGERGLARPRGPRLNGGGGRVVAVGVLSWPTARCRGREGVFGLGGLSYREKILWANQNVRTISRVIVHPQFRGLGLASLIVREICREAPTRYVEALAVMGRAHPFFEKGGMRRAPGSLEGPVYYWRERAMTNEVITE